MTTVAITLFSEDPFLVKWAWAISQALEALRVHVLIIPAKTLAQRGPGQVDTILAVGAEQAGAAPLLLELAQAGCRVVSLRRGWLPESVFVNDALPGGSRGLDTEWPLVWDQPLTSSDMACLRELYLWVKPKPYSPFTDGFIPLPDHFQFLLEQALSDPLMMKGDDPIHRFASLFLRRFHMTGPLIVDGLIPGLASGYTVTLFQSAADVRPGRRLDLDRVVSWVAGLGGLSRDEDVERLPPVAATEGPRPLISVIIPAYNHARYLPATLDSVLAQPLQDFEIIVVDDGSTDNTAEVLAPYRGKVRYLRKKNDGLMGPGAALNMGLSLCRGRFIHCLDSDDLVLPQTYETALEHLFKHPEIGFVCANARKIDDEGNPLGDTDARFDPRRPLYSLLRNNFIISSTVLARRECYEQGGIRRPQYEICDDYELWLRFVERFAFHLIPQPLIQYRVHPGGISRHVDKVRRLDTRIQAEFRARHGLEEFFPGLVLEGDLRRVAQAYTELADTFVYLRRPYLAAREVRLALRLYPDDSKATTVMGLAYLELGLAKEALGCLDRALGLDFMNMRARKLRSRLLAGHGAGNGADIPFRGLLGGRR